MATLSELGFGNVVSFANQSGAIVQGVIVGVVTMNKTPVSQFPFLAEILPKRRYFHLTKKEKYHRLLVKQSAILGGDRYYALKANEVTKL